MFKLPSFHLQMDVYRGPAGGGPPLVLISAGVSCQLHRVYTGAQIIKTPKGTNLPLADQSPIGVSLYGNVPAGSGDYYRIEQYAGVAVGYTNEHEQYFAAYSIPPSTLPHG